MLLLRNYGSEAFDCERKIMIACKVRIYLSNCKSACNDFDLYLFYAGAPYLIYAGMDIPPVSYYAGSIIDIVKLYEGDQYVIYARMNSNCMRFTLI